MNLYSKEWCNLIFKDRNKSYGAYKLRKETGRRYALALLIVVASLTILCIIPIVVDTIYDKAHRRFVVEVQRLSDLEGVQVKEANKPLPKDKRIETKQNDKALGALKQSISPKQSIRWEGEIANIEEEDLELRPNIDSEGSEIAEIKYDASLKEAESTEQTAGRVVEEMPIYPGGLPALQKWLEQTMVYPAACIRRKIEGNVEATFIVNKDGSISDIRISKSVHKYLDDETMRVIRKMQKWQPGKKNGIAQIVRITIPVEFRLE